MSRAGQPVLDVRSWRRRVVRYLVRVRLVSQSTVIMSNCSEGREEWYMHTNNFKIRLQEEVKVGGALVFRLA